MCCVAWSQIHVVCHTLVRFIEFHKNIEFILERLIGKSVKVWLSKNKNALNLPFVLTLFIIIGVK